jgi:hypothetical protein
MSDSESVELKTVQEPALQEGEEVVVEEGVHIVNNIDDLENKESKGTKIEPLEVEQDLNESIDDMESLLPGQTQKRQQRRKEDTPMCCKVCIKPQQVGNMRILFPERYHSQTSSWGVVGPQPFGPVCVSMILSVATYYIVKRAMTFGIPSVLICYIFYTTSIILLADVSFRDPGICFDKNIPETTSSDEARQWRWCDFCGVFQPPDGAHCPECNICVAGYDHHCVWMGTCIGKKNHRQFLKFNMSWLYYLLYVFVWLIIIGQFIKDP